MKIDSKKIIKDSKDETKKGRVTLYLDLELYERFKKICDSSNTSSSRVIEELMKAFVEDFKK